MSQYEKYIGQVIDGRYRVDDLLGEGGMATVFYARDLKRNKKVAIKLLKEEFCEDRQAVKRFINESKAVAMLNHPNIVKINDVVMNDRGKYLVMEYIEGETLRDYMDRVGAIPFDRVVDMLTQILEALDHAHGKGVVHRDIKPQNIIVLKNGKVVVTDFGIAKIIDSDPICEDKAIGTVYYISPEQASGEPIDHRSDLYSLGAMLFEMLTGRLPFDGDSTLSIAMQQINSQPPSLREILPTIPTGMEQFVLYAMAKSPEERFQSAKQMLLYLQALEDDPFAEFAVTPKEHYNRSLDSQNEKKKKSDKKREVVHVRGDSWSPFPVMLGVLTAFFIVLIVAGYYAVDKILLNSSLNVFVDRSGEDIVIGDFVGKPFTEADRAHLLEDLNYKKVTIKEEYNGIVKKGTVISQDPAAGEVRKLNVVELTVVISKGSNVVEDTFPDYSMKDYREIRLKLRDMGYDVEMIPERTSAVDACLVIRTEPAAGGKIESGMKVRVYYSEGPVAEDLVYNFPEFVGMREREVVYYVDQYGLNLTGVAYVYSDTVDAGRVISSSVARGPRPKLTPLSLTVSLGPDPSKPMNEE